MSLTVELYKALGGFTLDVAFEAGDCFHGLLGASGCGKSLTLQCIAGVVKPDRGRIVLDGTTLYDSARGIDLSPQKRGVGLLFQNYALFPNMTVRQNILAGLHGVKNHAQAELRCRELLVRMRLEGLEGHRPAQLSGGQQQRAALARILATRPKLLLLDEPFSALDGYLRWQTELELMELLRDFTGTTLLVSHDRGEVFRLCRTACVLSGGRSEPVRDVRALFDTPKTVASCLLTGCRNIGEAIPAGANAVSLPGWGITLRCAQPLPAGLTHVGVRGERILPADRPGDNTLLLPVRMAFDDVSASVVLLELPGGTLLRAELDKQCWTSLGAPERLLVKIQPEDVLLLEG